MSYCKVVLTNSLQTFSDQGLLSYLVPEEIKEQIAVGSLVLVPFREKKENALIIDLYEEIQDNEKSFKFRRIEDVILPYDYFKSELLELIKFTADYYACSYQEACQAAFPTSLVSKPQKTVVLLADEENHPIINALKKARNKRAKWTRLKTLCQMSEEEFKKEIDKLKKRKFLEITYGEVSKKIKKTSNPLNKIAAQEHSQHLLLTDEQQKVFDYIVNYENQAQKFLLHGVTGSGKTEVYMCLIDRVLARNQSVIFLIPEIALAPQLLQRLAKRFGEDTVLVWHSALSVSEKNFAFQALQEGLPKIVLGARSAIFAPVHNLGLIVIDEEHENTYKQEEPNPRYHAIKVAEKRAELNSCPLVFGSATPGIDLYYKALSDSFSEYHLLKINKRVFANPLPEVKIVDMCHEFQSGNKSIFSRALREAIDESLAKKEQVILFLNKRGTASHVFCRNCGFVYNCSNCDSKTVYHADKRKLICHHCGYQENHPSECPNCQAETIKFFGLGTQKLEEQTIKTFPRARVARLDSDNARLNNNYLKIWQAFSDREIDILIGTQMIAKGLDLPELTTVGVISADVNLNQLDFKADERAFQLLTQVAGRAGRASKPGKVILQTYQPESIIINFARDHDYEAFYQHEIKLRQELNYPPFGVMVRFRANDENEPQAIASMNSLHKIIFEVLKPFVNNISILGPCPCLVTRINNKYRYHMLLKIPVSLDVDRIVSLLKSAYAKVKSTSKSNLIIDVDNITLL